MVEVDHGPNPRSRERMELFDSCSPKMRAFLREFNVMPPPKIIEQLEQMIRAGIETQLDVRTPTGTVTYRIRP